jgi:hypothetical protein
LTEQDFSFWEVNKRRWNAEPGDLNILAGNASENIRGITKVTIRGITIYE